MENINAELDKVITVYMQKISLEYMIKYWLMNWIESLQEIKLIEDIQNEEVREREYQRNYWKHAEQRDACIDKV